MFIPHQLCRRGSINTIVSCFVDMLARRQYSLSSRRAVLGHYSACLLEKPHSFLVTLIEWMFLGWTNSKSNYPFIQLSIGHNILGVCNFRFPEDSLWILCM